MVPYSDDHIFVTTCNEPFSICALGSVTAPPRKVRGALPTNYPWEVSYLRAGCPMASTHGSQLGSQLDEMLHRTVKCFTPWGSGEGKRGEQEVEKEQQNGEGWILQHM